MPFALANQSIVEIRTVGGAVLESTQTQTAVPAGNAHCQLFLDMIVAYDGKDKSNEERRQIQSKVDAIVGDAKKFGVDVVQVDFSATHSQAGGCEGSELFGDYATYESIKALKKKVDPLNRFRCHPFVTLL